MMQWRWLWVWDFARETGVTDISLGVSYRRADTGRSWLIYLLFGALSIQLQDRPT